VRRSSFTDLNVRRLSPANTDVGAARPLLWPCGRCNVRSERSPLHNVRQHAPADGPLNGRNRSQPRIRFLTDEICRPGSGDRRWWSQTGSNRRPPACKAGALPTELWPRAIERQNLGTQQRREMVGLGRFELPTSRLSSARSNQLSYRPRAHAQPAQDPLGRGQRMLQRPWKAWARPRRKRNEDGEVPPKNMPVLKRACSDVFLRDPIEEADASL
jgi:hypothetical protein